MPLGGAATAPTTSGAQACPGSRAGRALYHFLLNARRKAWRSLTVTDVCICGASGLATCVASDRPRFRTAYAPPITAAAPTNTGQMLSSVGAVGGAGVGGSAGVGAGGGAGGVSALAGTATVTAAGTAAGIAAASTACAAEVDGCCCGVVTTFPATLDGNRASRSLSRTWMAYSLAISVTTVVASAAPMMAAESSARASVGEAAEYAAAPDAATAPPTVSGLPQSLRTAIRVELLMAVARWC